METTKGYWIRYYGNKASVVWSDVEKVGKRFHVEHDMSLARKRAYSGFLSSAAQTIIHRRLFAWMESIRVGNHAYNQKKAKEQKRLIFVTLTLSASQHHSDKWIKKNMLVLFLKRMQNKFGIVNYFWKAETQKNGNLHFHLILDTYIPMSYIQSNWNDIQRSHGYLDLYFSLHLHYNAPSTHVRELSAMNDGIGYAMKYCKKNENCRKIDGAIFRFSDSLLDITIPPILILPEYEKEWGDWCVKNVIKVIKEDFWTALFFNTRSKGFKQPAFIAKETYGYYLCAYDILYRNTVLDFSMKDLNDSTFNMFPKEKTPAQLIVQDNSAGDSAQEVQHTENNNTGTLGSVGLQLSLLDNGLSIPIHWPF